jgi:hypothetical protein
MRSGPLTQILVRLLLLVRDRRSISRRLHAIRTVGAATWRALAHLFRFGYHLLRAIRGIAVESLCKASTTAPVTTFV